MARTNIVIDDNLIQAAMQISGTKTKKDAVEFALRKLVSKAALLESLQRVRGKLSWKGDLKSMRKRRP